MAHPLPTQAQSEDRLEAELNVPVFHDDQHDTAVVTLAALLNAVELTGRRIEDLDGYAPGDTQEFRAVGA